MADSKGFRRGFLLGTTKKSKKKAIRTVAKVSSALLDLESPRHSIFAVQEDDPHPGTFTAEREPHPTTKGLPLLTAVKTKRKPQATLFIERAGALGEGADDTSNILLNPSVPEEEQKGQNPQATPTWLLAENFSQSSESQMTNDFIDAQQEHGNVDIADEFADTLLRMRRSSDWRKIGSKFVHSHLQTISKRNAVWDLILEGDLTLAKSRLAFCLLQHGIDRLTTALRDTGSKTGRYRAMRCLAIIDYCLDQEDVSSDLVGSVLPEIGHVATSEKERTRLTQQAVEVAIRLISSASLVGSRDPDMAELLHSKMSTVDRLLDTQKAWLASEKEWFTVGGARSWCKHAVIEYWQNLNERYRVSGTETSWCKELQGLDKISGFASTLLPSPEFSIDAFLGFLKLSLERKDFSCEPGLIGFLAWMSRRGTRMHSEHRDKYDGVEKLLLDLLARQKYSVPILAAL